MSNSHSLSGFLYSYGRLKHDLPPFKKGDLVKVTIVANGGDIVIRSQDESNTELTFLLEV
jgi:hypothetical protein